MPMPSIVWDYFDEFEGGGKCRLCGCIRNRKDKSTSTFWQHLERVHGLDKRQMLINSSTNNIPCGKMKPPSAADTNGDSTNGHKRGESIDTVEKVKTEVEPAEKMPKLELMTDLDRQATEETFKFISELVKQQNRSSLSPAAAEVDDINAASVFVSQQSEEKMCETSKNKKVSNGISPIGISLNSLEEKGMSSGLIGIASSADGKTKKAEAIPIPTEAKLASLNDYINGLLDISSLSPKNETSSRYSSPSPPNFSLAKIKTPAKEGTPTKKRNDYLKWDEFFMGIAILSGQRSKDPHTQVGACIVKENIIIGIGYNGMPNGCDDDQMPWGKVDSDPLNTKYPYVCHAEMNAILNKNCADIQNATIYTTLFPCHECAKLIIQSRIKNVIYLKDKDAIEMNASRRLFDITNITYRQFETTRDVFTIRFK